MTKRAGKKKQAHVTVVPEVSTAETMANESTGFEAVSQSGSTPALPDQPNDNVPKQSEPLSTDWTVFWPELEPEAMEQARSRGQGDALKRVQEFRTELMALNNGFPIPQALRARMVYEATKAMLNPKQSLRERFWAVKLLAEMDKSNRAPSTGLPDQVQNVNVQVNVDKPDSEPSVSPQEIVAELLTMPAVLHAIDRYEFKDDGVDYAQ